MKREKIFRTVFMIAMIVSVVVYGWLMLPDFFNGDHAIWGASGDFQLIIMIYIPIILLQFAFYKCVNGLLFRSKKTTGYILLKSCLMLLCVLLMFGYCFMLSLLAK